MTWCSPRSAARPSASPCSRSPIISAAGPAWPTASPESWSIRPWRSTIYLDGKSRRPRIPDPGLERFPLQPGRQARPGCSRLTAPPATWHSTSTCAWSPCPATAAPAPARAIPGGRSTASTASPSVSIAAPGRGVLRASPVASWPAGGGRMSAPGRKRRSCTAPSPGWGRSRPGISSRKSRVVDYDGNDLGMTDALVRTRAADALHRQVLRRCTSSARPSIGPDTPAGSRARVDLEATLDFSMVNSLPYNDYSADHDVWGVKTTLHNWGYYYSLGYTPGRPASTCVMGACAPRPDPIPAFPFHPGARPLPGRPPATIRPCAIRACPTTPASRWPSRARPFSSP